jgi:hypothetical protein
MSNFVKWNEFDPSRLIGGPIKSGESQPKPDPNDPKKTKTVKFQYTIPEYEYDVVNKTTNEVTKCIGPLRIQLCPITSNRGLNTKIGMSGYEKTSIFCKLDMSDPNVRSMCSMGEEAHDLPDGMWKKFYGWCSDYLWDNKSNIEIVKALPQKPLMAAIFGFPLSFKMTDEGKISNNNPTRYFEVKSFGKVGSSDHSGAVFTVPKVIGTVAGKPVYEKLDWNLLSNVKMKFIPMVKFKRIYIGTKASMQMYIDSAVVLDLKPASEDDSFDDLLGEYSKDAKIVSTIDSQLDALRARLNVSNAVEEKKEEVVEEEVVVPTKSLESLSLTPAPEVSLPKPATIAPLPTAQAPLPTPVSAAPSFGGTTNLSALLGAAPTNSAQ